jgi:type II secretory pathway pseudopilin PulG
MLNKGAMFGLDARIALAIFGALSVISGAALYSAIKDAKITSFYTYVQEISKASEQYFLDTGVQVKQVDGFRLYAGNLIENFASVDNWKGPYFSTSEVHSSGLYFYTDLLGPHVSTYLFYYTDDEWASSTPVNCTNLTANCYSWVMFHATDSNKGFDVFKDVFEDLDKKYDNSDGANKGNIRRVESSATNSHVYYKSFKYLPR